MKAVLPSMILCILSTQAAQIPYYPPDAVKHATLSSDLEDFEKIFNFGWSPTSYHGIVTAFGLQPIRCFGADKHEDMDIAILGAPFDTATTFRPGARFGPNAIRQGTRRIGVDGFSYNVPMKVDPIKGKQALKIVDCGDVPMSLFDNPTALTQLETAYGSLLKRAVHTTFEGTALTRSGDWIPRVLTLGGDHTILLPILRRVAAAYGPVSVIHFDSHIDSWRPSRLTGKTDDDKYPITHGSMLWLAAEEGLIANGSSIHVGIRTPLLDLIDYENDEIAGFTIVEAEEIEDIGYKGVVDRIKQTVGDRPVYLSIDIDVIDPGFAGGTGTPEIGGYTTREMKKILHSLDGLKIVGADIVEVAPAYDGPGQLTEIAAGNIAWESKLDSY